MCLNANLSTNLKWFVILKRHSEPFLPFPLNIHTEPPKTVLGLLIPLGILHFFLYPEMNLFGNTTADECLLLNVFRLRPCCGLVKLMWSGLLAKQVLCHRIPKMTENKLN